MSFSKISAVAGAIAFASKVAAHGTVTGIVADGVYYAGYSPSYQYLEVEPVVVGWSVPEDLSNGFIAPDAYATSDIICHLAATNAQTSADVTAGGTVELQWTAWPESHKGPVIDYLAACTNGDCTTVDKTTLEFFKIDGVGLLDDTTLPGTWASDTLIANNNSWTVTIPSDIAPGNYVLRHEIIALHSAGTVDGAQNYPQCINLNVIGTGTEVPTGTLGEALYTETDPGIEVNIYATLTTYVVPGPTLYAGAESAVQTVVAATETASSVVAVSTSAPAATSAPATSSAVAAASSVVAAAGVSSARYTNGTATACLSKKPTNTPVPVKSTASASAAAATTTQVAVAAVQSTTIVTSVASATATQPVATSTSTASAETIPAGTTLDTVLAWISSFYTKYGSTTYTASTTMRRSHARDVIARDA